MNWQPIETYDALKKKPAHAVFLFRAEVGRTMTLDRTIHPQRNFGLRVCTHWLELPSPPKE